MQLAEQIIVVESSMTSDGETAEHIKLIAGDTPDVIFHLSLRQARSLAISLVEQVHRLEVVNSMRKTKLQQTCSVQCGVKSTMVLNAPGLRSRNSNVHSNSSHRKLRPLKQGTLGS